MRQARTLWQRLRTWSLTSTSMLALLAYLVSFAAASQRGMADTTSATLSNDMISAYIADKTLLLAQKQTRISQLGEKATLPKRNSKTWQYTRYERLALPQSTLTEGVTPASTQMSVTPVTAVVEQWGQVVVLTDIAELVIKHPIVQKGIELLALAAAETRDREIQKVLLAGSNIQYAASRTSRATLQQADYISTTEVRKLTANLRNNGARPYEADDLFGVLDPSVEMDMSLDSTFLTAASYSNIVALKNAEIGKWHGVRWTRSNFLHTFTGYANTGYSLADAATGGAITAGATTYVVVTGINDNTGFEEKLWQENSQAAGADGLTTHKVTVTVPSTAGYTYNIYAGTVSGTTYLVTTGVAPSGTYDITTVPTSGTTNPAIPLTATGTVHMVWVFGKEAFASIELDGMSLQTYVTPKQSTDSDPLQQRRKIGWKLAFKAVICNNNFMRRLECTSAYN